MQDDNLHKFLQAEVKGSKYMKTRESKFINMKGASHLLETTSSTRSSSILNIVFQLEYLSAIMGSCEK